MGRLRRNIAGAMAGVALGVAAERTAEAHQDAPIAEPTEERVAAEPREEVPMREDAPAKEVPERRDVSSGRAKRYEAEFGMTDGDAEVLSRSVDLLFGDDANASNEAFVQIVGLLQYSATTPPSVFGFIAHEAQSQMEPDSEVAVGARFRLVRKEDGQISVYPPEGAEIVLVKGSGASKTVEPEISGASDDVVGAKSERVERPDDVPAYALRDPWLVDSAEGGRGGEATVTYEMIMGARGDRGAMTTVLLEMRDDFEGSDAAFNVQLQEALGRMQDYWGVGQLDCNFGSYRLDDKGNLWVDAPDKKPVRVVAAKSS